MMKTDATGDTEIKGVSAYLCLEDCEVFWKGKSNNDNVVSSFKSNRQWMDLRIVSNDDGLQEEEGEKKDICSQCHLVLFYLQKKEVACHFHLRFDGTMGDISCHSCRRQKRSDPSLLLGLAFACQDIESLIIKRIQISCSMFNKASLKITLEIPRVSKESFLTTSKKFLPPCTQLLLNLLKTSSPSLSTIRKRNRASLFPSKLSLEQVYQRIGGAACQETLYSAESSVGKTFPSSSQITMFQLPREILRDHIAVYLKAKSLHSLRCTCKYLFSTLSKVVPGLTLQLYQHQVRSLAWMRRREIRSITEQDLFRSGNHCAASGGASCQLGKDLSISQYSGVILSPLEEADHRLSRKMARGGLLCDDPGLGKTITVVSLILQTLGLTTCKLNRKLRTFEKKKKHSEILKTIVEIPDSSDGEEDSQKSNEDRIFCEYWKESVVPEYRTQYFNKLLNSLVKTCRQVDYFVYPIDLDQYPDYTSVVRNKPVCIKDIRKKVNKSEYGASFQAFVSDVALIFDNAKTYNFPGSIVYEAAVKVERIFNSQIEDFQQQNIRTAKKSFAKASAKPNSTVAALVEFSEREKLEKSLVSSAATLLVVPSVLLEHWQDQLRLHVNTQYCTNKIPISFVYTGNSNTSNLKMEEIVTQCKIRKTHFCFLFIDKSSTKSLPSPEFLAMFSIVITTNQRFTNEWKNGSFQEELKRNDNSRNTNYRVDLTFWDLDEQSASSLLKVNWLRLIVDEGHSMGRGKDNSAISFASWIHAERRWAMTGTPTRQTLSQTGLSSILNLLQYLQHSFFERKKDGDTVWQTLITRGWNRGHLSSFYRVQNLLSLLMVRHTKMDIEELPLPTYKTTILPMSGDEVTTYNTLVCAIQSNLIITAMQGKTSGKQDSLLHKTQAKHAKKALVNVRLVCAGGTQVLPTLSQQFWEEFIHDFKICNHNAHSVSKVRRYLKRATTGKLSSCDCCGIALSTLLVFPCGDLVCTECTSPQNHVCVVCQKPFDVDLFQRLQPGMDYQWLHNVEEEKSALKNKQGLLSRDSDTPVDAGIGQVLLLQGGAGMMAPVNPQQQERHRRTKKPGDGHVCEFCPKLANGECRLCLKEHDDCNFMSDGHTCPVCFKRAEECPESETKSAHVVSKLLDLHQNFETYQLQQALQSPLKSTEISHEKRPLKVIVFSQFRKVLNMTGDRLLRRFGSAAVAEYWGSFRRKELHKFIYSKECVCMLLGKDGSEGLDLSFVTHIFFMEKVWDKSLEQQAVARAWRMGAKGSVEVETLVAKTSVEESMNRLEQLGSTEGSNNKSSEYQRAKLQYLLKGLSLIANPYAMSYGGNSDISRAALPSEWNTGQKEEPPAKKRRSNAAGKPIEPEPGDLSERTVRFAV